MHAKDLFFVIPTYRLREVGSQGAATDSRKQSTEAGGLVLLGRRISFLAERAKARHR
jgi:hypothetical protein